MNSKLPAPAIAAATNPKSVGIVRDAKINDANVISMMKFKLINKFSNSLTKPSCRIEQKNKM